MKMKKIASLGLCFAVMMTTVGCAESIDTSEHEYNQSFEATEVSESFTIQDGAIPIPTKETQTNYLIISNQTAVTNTYWDQPRGYTSYRISLNNTSSVSQK